MHDDDGQSVPAVGLPVAVTENLDARLNFDEAFFGGRENAATANEEVGDGLDVSATQAAARPKFGEVQLSLRSRHN
jgi:hypothetical protein